MKPILTIAVPLYKEIFIDRLDIIIPQLTNEVKLLIINDNTNLNIETLILKKYGRIDNLEIINNNKNLGLGTNLSNCFYFTNTKWMWLLGDDDIILDNSIQTILNRIKKSNSILIKFSYTHDKPSGQEYTMYKNKQILGLDNLISELYLEKNDLNIGTMIFMSNSIFNIEKLTPFISIAFKNTYSYAPHFAIILEYLSMNPTEAIELSEEQLVINYYPKIEDKWTRFIVALGILNLQYMILNISVETYKKLIKILYKFINFRFIFLSISNTLSTILGLSIIKYKNLYKIFSFIKSVLANPFSYSCLYINFDFGKLSLL